jgi:single-stranded DNA-binding protein
MTNESINNNEVELLGTVESDLSFSHEVYGEGFYKFILDVPRLSDISDKISVTVSERLLTDINLTIGQTIFVSGQFRSYNNYSQSGNKLILTVFARDIVTDQITEEKNPNHIFLNGFLCKKPVYRTTPFGREITDILIAVNRAYNKSDYIPAIAWGRNARFASTLEVGENVKIWGRIQSRDYQKKIDEENVVTKTAYEISISKMDISTRPNIQFEII